MNSLVRKSKEAIEHYALKKAHELNVKKGLKALDEFNARPCTNCVWVDHCGAPCKAFHQYVNAGPG